MRDDHSPYTFEGQFEPHGDAFYYRPGGVGIPKTVTREERDRFVAQFRKHDRWLMRASVAAILAAVIALFALNESTERRADPSSLIIVGIFVTVFMVAFHVIWHRPRRLLADRHAFGPEVSAADMRRAYLRGLTWFQLLGAAGLGAALLFAQSRQHDLGSWNLIWWAIGALCATLLIYLVIKKWRADRES